jgi:hypothetical protein
MSINLNSLQMVCVHIVEKYSTNPPMDKQTMYKIPDVRCSKPLMFHCKNNDQLVFLQRMLDFKIGKKTINLSLPNEIGIALNVFTKARDKAQLILKNLKENSKEKDDFYEDNIKLFYDYLEQIQVSLIFSYKAVESFCNATIPNDFIYKKKNSKGIQEMYGMLEIERWVPTSEKLTEIIPEILKCQSPKSIKHWTDFKDLEKLRNEIIHCKKSNSIEITKKLLSNNILQTLNSSIFMLKHFIKEDVSNEMFPLGFLDYEWKMYEVDDPSEIFEWISRA